MTDWAGITRTAFTLAPVLTIVVYAYRFVGMAYATEKSR